MPGLLEDEDSIFRDAQNNDPYDFANMYESEVDESGVNLIVEVGDVKYSFDRLTLDFIEAI